MSDPRTERAPRRRRRRLALSVRIWLWVASAVVILLGIAGLVLPGLQGILLLILGAALLSLASETVDTWLEGILAERFPKLWRRLERFRTRVHWRFRRPPRGASGERTRSDE
jgi:hypothetical protein